MTGFSFASQNDWYVWGTLVTQLAFLFAALWFARNFLKLLRAFQEQIGALLKLSLTPGPEHSASDIARRSLGESSPYWLPHSEASAAYSRQHAVYAETPSLPRGLLHWLQAPMHSSGVSSWRRFANWLQAPAGS